MATIISQSITSTENGSWYNGATTGSKGLVEGSYMCIIVTS